MEHGTAGINWKEAKQKQSKTKTKVAREYNISKLTRRYEDYKGQNAINNKLTKSQTENVK